MFPLERYLGCSDHSGVFFTRSTAPDSTELAIKLVPTTRSRAASQLPRWKRAAGVTHAQLLRLLEWGGCQLEGSPHLYAVMEFADQTLAQLLEHRTLTGDEAREMLPPIVEALEFLHGQNLVQGQLKPTNILVVGDQIKLASDTIRRAGEVAAGGTSPTAYDPPEARRGGSSTADDIWALGVTLFQALTGRIPGSWSMAGDVVFPADFPPAFRVLVERCLHSKPEDRPAAAEILAWAEGRPLAFELARPPGPRTAAPTPTPAAPTPTPTQNASAAPPAATAAPMVDTTSAAAAAPIVDTTSAADAATTDYTLESLPAPAIAAAVAPLVPPPSLALVALSASPTSPTLQASSTSQGAPSSPASRASQTPEASPGSWPPPSMDATSSKPRSMLGLILGLIVIVALVWFAWRLIRADHSQSMSSPAPQSAAESSSVPAGASPGQPTTAPALPSQAQSAASLQTTSAAASTPSPPASAPPSSPASSPSSPTPASSSASAPSPASPAGIHEVIPDVSPTARRTIRGHIKVWVRVVVEADGSVLAAVVERASSSGYFRRLAAEAAKKWTFPPADTQARRVTQIQFDFSRDQTTAHAQTPR
ncbi:MAG TPA: protein kinase [Steroidobacteraceae bacterium]|nr:protein kinase [Steroidobacteraceae bacterium]